MIRPLSNEHPLIVYGAVGATGRLIVEVARARGLPVAVAGRSRGSLEALGLPILTAAADDPAGLAALAARGSILLNAAGPFVQTGAPLAQAAIAGGAAYIDVGGEVDVLVSQKTLDARARAAGLPLVCAAGYGVTAGEGLALHVARRVAGARRLRLGLDTYVGHHSAGASQSTIAGLKRGNYEIADARMRRTGIADRPWTIELDGEAFLFAGAPLAEGWAAAQSTGVPNVRVGIRTRRAMIPIFRIAALAVQFGPVERFMARQATSAPTGEGESGGAAGKHSTLIAEAWGANGGQAASALIIRREGYAVSAEIAVAAVEAMAGSKLAGFHTPGSAFGPDFILGVKGVERWDFA